MALVQNNSMELGVEKSLLFACLVGAFLEVSA
jgi:hypothetical protein